MTLVGNRCGYSTLSDFQSQGLGFNPKELTDFQSVVVELLKVMSFSNS